MAVFADLVGTLRSFWQLGPKASRLTLGWGGLTAPRTVQFPDKSGTLAMTSDASAPVPLLIADGQTYTVADNTQVLVGEALAVDGGLVIDGALIEVNL